MSRPPRRVNDAQVERLLDAMKRDVKYRQSLARRLVAKEGHAPGTRVYQRRYASIMRRFQRYITEATEKRSFARSPVDYKREVRQEARAVPYPVAVAKPITGREGEQIARDARVSVGGGFADKDFDPENFHPHLNDIRAIFAYFDGELSEMAWQLNLDPRGERLIDLAVTGEGIDVFAMRGGGLLKEAIREFYDGLEAGHYQDIQDVHDLFMNLPNWQIGMILGDIEDGETTFAEWIDAWHNDGMDLDGASEEYWALWRAAYARSKAA